MLRKLGLSLVTLFALTSVAVAQNGFWNNWPIANGSAYSCGSVNGVSNCTVPAGPAITGNEQVPANAGSTTQPPSILIPMAALNALPLTFVNVSAANPSGISASNISGGVVYDSTVTITSASITLPQAPINGQQYRISSNRNITTLSVTAGAANSIAANTSPTVLSTNTTGGTQSYNFVYRLSNTTWYRLQ